MEIGCKWERGGHTGSVLALDPATGVLISGQVKMDIHLSPLPMASLSSVSCSMKILNRNSGYSGHQESAHSNGTLFRDFFPLAAEQVEIISVSSLAECDSGTL